MKTTKNLQGILLLFIRIAHMAYWLIVEVLQILPEPAKLKFARRNQVLTSDEFRVLAAKAPKKSGDVVCLKGNYIIFAKLSRK